MSIPLMKLNKKMAKTIDIGMLKYNSYLRNSGNNLLDEYEALAQAECEGCNHLSKKKHFHKATQFITTECFDTYDYSTRLRFVLQLP